MIVGIDSMVLIYANAVPVKSQSKRSKEFEELSVRAKLLLHILTKSKKDVQIVLPTVAIAELLTPVQKHLKGNLTSELSKMFICAPFDLHAASIASDLWAAHGSTSERLKYKNRHLLKSDVMIIGSAMSAGATDFYTHDKKCRELASIVMNAHDLPTHDPDDMFAADDIRRGDL